MIEYKQLPSGDIAVWLEGRRVGTITQWGNGYRYEPIKGKNAGSVLPTVQAVKQSLETDDD